jgi:hypothetical protein
MYKRWIDGTRIGRLGTAMEVASVVLFLALESASFDDRERGVGGWGIYVLVTPIR